MEHHTSIISESEQMYLLTIARLAEDGVAPPVPLGVLAQALAIQSVSANQMVRKLADLGLLTYLPYKGVELTRSGEQIALRTLRSRRLWESFLVTHLGMPIIEADALACRLEHLTSDDVAQRLAGYLDHPEFSPQGKPIPSMAPTEQFNTIPLTRLALDQQAVVVYLRENQALERFFREEGIYAGVLVRVAAIGESYLIEIQDRLLQITSRIAESIQVRPIRAHIPHTSSE